MATPIRAPNARQLDPLEDKAGDALRYRWGWLMGLAFGALTAAYRYAG
ncbi:MAG: hypothetical protein Nkreftii_001182 [Candidatus Nitrospira kreftii]|uniref:Uncharacterized protein n=1 Tax=Candidatus Nitrospira kreftii TaxID=2652173 RepID=A0A7S8IYM1_9BACT|nr:MAG: hypothetical protein Nkreftii_001182 [Candidatus Nitrospira kreftii]